MLPDRAPSRERLGVGYGSRLELEQAQLQSDEGQHERPKFVLGSVHARLDYAEHVARRRATSMLCLGSVFGFLGFIVAALLGMYHTYAASSHDLNLHGEPFPSGESYWPQSVSEMVQDPRTPTGKVWMCFQVIAAISIWLSWYPWELRNVYVGGEVKLLWCVPFLHLRTFVPPVGMLMVVFVPLSLQSDFGNTFATAIHLIGAGVMLGGYGLCEAYTLAFAEYVKIQAKERIIRTILCVCCLLNGLGFLVFGHLPTGHLCCGDVWRVPTEEDAKLARTNGYPGIAVMNELAMAQNVARLYDTASGTLLVFKYLTYWCEVGAGFSMIASMIAIWLFAPERTMEVGNEIPEKDGEDSDYEDSDLEP